MKSVELLPSPHLRPYVHLFWCFESDASSEGLPPERIAPDGIVEAVFHYQGGSEVRFAGGPFRAQPRSAVLCQARRYIDIRGQGPIGLLTVRFRPWGALHFMKPPVDELADQVVSAEEVWGPAVVDLEERLALARSTRSRFALVERFLAGRLDRHRKDGVEPAIRAVWRHRGNVRIAELSRELGISERTAHRVFRAAVGMPPKAYARLSRFLHACALLNGGVVRSLTELAHECGYYDQAHFSNDFRAFSGITPGRFAADRGISFLPIE